MSQPEPGDFVCVLIDGEPYTTVIDDHGTQRFIQNDVIDHMFQIGMIDLTKVYIEVLTQKLDEVDYMRLHMSLGFSVSGFMEKFGPGGSWEDNGREPVTLINPLWIDEEETRH